MEFSSGSQERRRDWRSIRWRRSLIVIAQTVYWITYAVLSVIGTGGGAPASRNGASPAGAYTSGLVLGRTKGIARDRQATIRRTLPGQVISGRCWVMPHDFAWAPKDYWVERGARAFLLPLPTVRTLEVSFFRRAAGVVLLGDDAEVWLWMRLSDAQGLIAELGAPSGMP